ncbi:MAG: hypothetical protein ABW069_10990 [Duganella sp.]
MKRASLLLAWFPALLLLPLAVIHAPAQAQAQVGFGRLFTTPQERQALDARRGKAVAAGGVAPGDAPAPAAADAAGTMAGVPPGPPAGMPPRMPSELPGGAGPGMAPAMPPGMPPDTRPDLQQNMTDPSQAGVSGATGDAAPAPEQLTMNGVLRTSSGRSTVWLDNVPQRGNVKFSNRNSRAVTVTLPSGKRVVLQPGQRYDLADGRVKDINQP